MKYFLILIFIAILSSAKATTYYFSSVSGDDNRSASQAQTPSTPWKSLSKLNQIMNVLQPGDNVLFKRNETFYGSIVITRSGTSGSPIVFGAYGNGNKPVIAGLITLSNWQSSGNGIYEAADPSLGQNINTILLNNSIQQIGRFPNADGPNKGYLKFDSFDNNISITDNELDTKTNWTNAELVLRSARWKLDRDLITSQSGNTIYYKSFGPAKPKDKNFGYFIQNDIRTLDQFGEWYYSPSQKKVSIFFGSRKPSSYTIQAPGIDNLVTLKDVSNISFDNIIFKGANVYGINFKNANNLSIKNCDILFSGKDGINGSKGANINIENCSVQNSNSNGIELNSTTNSIVRNNLIKNTGTKAGMGFSDSPPYQGLILNGDNNLLEYNEVDSTGFIGIRFNGNNVTVKNNFVNTYCFVKDDGGGIYTHPSGTAVNTGRKIVGNIVINGIGAGEGTNSPRSSADGIYLDDNATGVEVLNNTVASAYKGIFVHNAADIVTNNNTVYNCDIQLSFTHDFLGKDISNNILTNNVLFSKSKNQNVLNVSSVNDIDMDAIGVLDSNYYFSPSGAKMITFISNANKGNKQNENYDLDAWKSQHRKDINTKKASKQFSDDDVRFEYNASANNKTITLDGNYTDPKNNKYSNRITLQPYTSAILIKDHH